MHYALQKRFQVFKLSKELKEFHVVSGVSRVSGCFKVSGYFSSQKILYSTPITLHYALKKGLKSFLFHIKFRLSNEGRLDFHTNFIYIELF
ncbi:MAG: hypothetical protein DWQ02_28735 [Bacteroidetes bacterium]|nr:MAG: hypothetical protein DWQ02_28735 [Bacteroidota bacterium]